MKLKLGSKLHAIREERRLTQAEMADLLNLPLSSYSRIERNESSVEFDKLTAIAGALRIPIHELLPETVSIINNNHNPGPGGGVIFGNQYFYLNEADTVKALLKEVEELKQRVKDLTKPQS